MTQHKCTNTQNEISSLLNRKESIISNNLLQKIYCIADNCLSCIDMADFLVEQKKLSLIEKRKRPKIESNLVEEKHLRELLLRYKLDDDKVIESFNEVISKTMSQLEAGQTMKLFSPGELLEARSGYAYAEMRNAVNRGVKFEYIIPGENYRHDFEKLNSYLLEVFSIEKLSTQIKVTYSGENKIPITDSKDVSYYDKNDKKIAGLVEVPFNNRHPFDSKKRIKSRLWVYLDKEKDEFLNALEQKIST